MKLKYILLSLVVIALVLGCAKPPLEEMQKAREAVFKAENDENAVAYGGGSLARARDALRRMQVEADSKRYDAAKNNANEAIQAAERAIADGQTAAARAKNEAEAMVAGLRPALEETERNLNGARYNQLRLDYGALNRDLNSARDSVEMAETDYAMARYQSAIDTGRAARATLTSINERISGSVVRRKG
jgi:hypothetical protein